MDGYISKKIDVTIAGRTFPIKVSESEVETIRNIENDLNQKISDFNLKYKDRDKLDCVIMTLLTVAVDNSESGKQKTNTEIIHNQLQKINELLEVSLS
jgi:cell division protein ZapA